jgi:hypothetical protein
MSSQYVFSAGAAAFVLMLGCSGGDLTLPGPDEPVTLMAVSGDGQRAEAGTLLDQPLTVQLLDGSSRPVHGTPIQFSFLGDLPGSGLDPASVLTDEQGRAEAIVRLGETLGEQVVVAQVTDTKISDLRVRFSATAVPPDGKDGGKKGKGKGQGGSHEDDD